MPAIELDLLIAFINPFDDYHEIASKIFEMIRKGKLKRIYMVTSALIEFELIGKSKGYSNIEIRTYIEKFRMYPNLGEKLLSSNILMKASEIREKFGLTYFDSLHGATALFADKQIISRDEAYDNVPELNRINPRNLP